MWSLLNQILYPQQTWAVRKEKPKNGPTSGHEKKLKLGLPIHQDSRSFDHVQQFSFLLAVCNESIYGRSERGEKVLSSHCLAKSIKGLC
jgi:hypothetical protein